MRVTYDNIAKASMICFTTISPGGVDETLTYRRMDADFDYDGQIVAFRVFASEKDTFHDRLEYAVRHPEVKLDESGTCLTISFVETAKVQQTITWDANIDLDKSGQILGIEILFADPDSGFDDDREWLYADGKLDHIAKYLVPFDHLG